MNMFRKFKFEEDFYDQLRCIPFCVRQKLDQSGIKLSLKSWNLFSEEERQKLCEMEAGNQRQADSYRVYLVSLLEKLGQPVKFLEASQLEREKELWVDSSRVPDEVKTKLSQLDLSLSWEDWGRLDDLQRFVLLKLSQGKHDHANLGPALKEFLNFKP
jgi:hypothetical protein